MSCLSPYKVAQVNEGRFLQWTPITYFLETQDTPIELCEPSTNPCNYNFSDDTEVYALPIQAADVVKWVMNQNEITIDSGSSLSDIKIGIVQEGILIAENVGTITSGGSQYFCTATIPADPCLAEGCDYQFVLYNNSITPPIEDCSLYNCSTVQDIIDTGYTVSSFYNCQVQDFYC